jgi:single-strand DNA-binding protein
MASSYNHVTLLGNLTRDPETRFTPSGTAVCQITLAVNRTWKDQNGEKKEECSFIDAVAFGRTAEVLAQYQRKGFQLLIDGRLKQDTWEDKNGGGKRSKIQIVIENMTMLKFPEDGDKAPARPDRTSQPDAKGGAAQPDAPEDDVPF